MHKPDIPTPTPEIVRSYLEKWDSLENYVLQEKSLELLFREAYPENKKIEHILIKVCCLNQFYSTNLYSPFMAAKHILALDIDKDLAAGNYELVNKISRIKIPNGRIINFYSFASKYCSHHRPERYPIYDSFVEKILLHFRRSDKFHEFSKDDIRNYAKFAEILQGFKKFYGLSEFSVKDIDRYLWQVGKEFFPKTYKKL
jgi:hypothetical protein